jgi:hypothetical protein
MGFVTVGRGSNLPRGAVWRDQAAGWWTREASDENVFHEIMRAYPGGVAGYRRIAQSEIPADRTYRDALSDQGGALHFDLPKARELHLARLRRDRVAQLEALDAQWNRAFASGDTAGAAAVEAQRQALRDMPQRVAAALAAAATIDELKLVE